MSDIQDKDALEVLDDLIERDSKIQKEEVDRLTIENCRLRAFVEDLTDYGTVYGDEWDLLHKHKLVVNVPPTQDFIDEWGDDSEMWALSWLVQDG